MGQRLTGQMGVETSQPPKTPFRDADAFEIGEHDAFCIPHDDRVHRAPAVHQDADLAIDFS